MKENRNNIKSPDAKRLDQIKFIMENWDQLPERFQGKFDGTIATVSDFLNEKKE